MMLSKAILFDVISVFTLVRIGIDVTGGYIS